MQAHLGLCSQFAGMDTDHGSALQEADSEGLCLCLSTDYENTCSVLLTVIILD